MTDDEERRRKKWMGGRERRRRPETGGWMRQEKDRKVIDVACDRTRQQVGITCNKNIRQACSGDLFQNILIFKSD